MRVMRPLAWSLAVGIAASGSSVVQAQNYPLKPVRIVTGGVGGGADLISRLIAQGISDLTLRLCATSRHRKRNSAYSTREWKRSAVRLQRLPQRSKPTWPSGANLSRKPAYALTDRSGFTTRVLLALKDNHMINMTKVSFPQFFAATGGAA